MRLFKTAVCLVAILSLSLTLQARENIGAPKTGSPSFERLAMNCDEASSQIDLDINNVRAKLLGGGDFWWDLNSAKYEVPKTEAGSGAVSASSIFAGALWIGGIDAGNNIKVAAMTYRQSGSDFWPGPIDEVTRTTTQEVCNDWDKHWKVNRTDIEAFLELSFPVSSSALDNPTYRSILEWPGRGNPFAKGKNDVSLDITKPMAPYIDVDGTVGYDPTQGDYPDFSGDQGIFWVYNDEGNIHSETGGQTIGLEIQCLAFAFQTNDQVNDMTFYKYKIINYNSSDLDSVHFGQWVDPDLGWYLDDFVGCDTSRSLGIVYNGDEDDGPGGLNYGSNPPLLGVDFFQGPTEYTFDLGGSIVDSQELGMSSFVFYNNDFTITGNPSIAQHYFGYLSGTWKDGTPFTFGGNGYGGSQPFPYMFPDVPGQGGWNECDAGNSPADRRFLQNAGPFTLKPGATNEVIVGVVWVPGDQTGCNADFQSLFLADDKAQDLFERDFQIANGPDAPDMNIRELDRELIISLFNDSANSNNYLESYSERIGFVDTSQTKDTAHDFEGYRVWQLKNQTVSASQLNYDNPDLAREIFQVDVKNGVTKIVNWSYDPTIGSEAPNLEVLGSDEGIRKTFSVTEDQFATGDRTLVNHKTYYFSVLAYAYNNAIPYDPSNSNSQRTPYFAGRRNIKVYTGIPHISDPENNGTILNAAFGDGVEIRQLEGMGNMGNSLELSESSRNTALNLGIDSRPTYEANAGPIRVFVYDPYLIEEDDFEITITGPTGQVTSVESSLQYDTLVHDSSYWTLTRLSDGATWTSEKSIGQGDEQLIPELGLAVQVAAAYGPGYYKGCTAPDTFYYPLADNNGLIEATIEFSAATNQWLSGVPDGEGGSQINWIRAGDFNTPTGSTFVLDDIDEAGDECSAFSSRNSDHIEAFETILGGTISPFGLVARVSVNASGVQSDELPNMPAVNFSGNSRQKPSIEDVKSIDLVFTPDNTKWTRAVVVEMTDRDLDSDDGGTSKWEVRNHPSWAKDKQVDEGTGAPVYDGATTGLSWFPGYAINVETGERVHIIFGEASEYNNDNGADMVWNPSSNIGTLVDGLVNGGMHTIYVTDIPYNPTIDPDVEVENKIGFFLRGNRNHIAGDRAIYRTLMKRIMWCSIPRVSPGFSLQPLTDQGGLIPTETRIRLRVSKPYQVRKVESTDVGMPKYSFSTRGLAATKSDATIAETACDLINIVPNPYYAYSNYEASKLDNRVRITNLPPQAEIKIFTLDGELVKKLSRDVQPDNTAHGILGEQGNQATYVDWDLKNFKNIPVASGMYLIHVAAEGLCERTLKFMAIMRPVDLDTF